MLNGLKLSLACAVSLLYSFAFGQFDSMCEILLDGQPIGKATVIQRGQDGVGHALTAAHVTEILTGEFSVRYTSGRKGNHSRVVWQDTDRDLACIQVWVPEDVVPVEVVDMDYQSATVFRKSGERSDIRFCIRELDRDFLDYTPETGESGGGCFVDGKLVGVVQGGWFWLSRKPESGGQRTWPLRIGRITPQELERFR